MAKKLAKITLVGPLSLAVGRYRFHKGKAVTSDDAELISYCKLNSGDFKVEEIEVAQTPAAEAKAPAAPSKAEPKAKAPVKEEESEDEESEEITAKESKSSSRLARKSKGDGA